MTQRRTGPLTAAELSEINQDLEDMDVHEMLMIASIVKYEDRPLYGHILRHLEENNLIPGEQVA